MSRFYGSVSGQAGTAATRTGSKGSGIGGHIRGWDLGVKVYGGDNDGRDRFAVYATGGSNGGRSERHLATVGEESDGRVRFAVSLADGGESVFYVSRTGEVTSR